MAWAFAIIALRWCISNIGLVFGMAWSALGWLLGTAVQQRLGAIISLLVTLKVYSWCVRVISPDLAKRIDPLPKLLPWLATAARKGVPAAFRLMRLLVEGIPARKEPKKKPRKEGD